MVPNRPDVAVYRVLVADDHEMLLEMLSLCLQSEQAYEVHTAKSLDDAVRVIERDGAFDVTLLDWNMPGMHGVNGLRRVMSLSGARPVAILTGEPTPKIVDEAMAAGAAGVVSKASGLRSLSSALSIFLSGERYLPYDLVAMPTDARTPVQDGLSRRELLVLREISKGKRNQEICADMQLALPTVKMHVSSIIRKLRAKNRLHAVIIARDLGLL